MKRIGSLAKTTTTACRAATPTHQASTTTGTWGTAPKATWVTTTTTEWKKTTTAARIQPATRGSHTLPNTEHNKANENAMMILKHQLVETRVGKTKVFWSFFGVKSGINTSRSLACDKHQGVNTQHLLTPRGVLPTLVETLKIQKFIVIQGVAYIPLRRPITSRYATCKLGWCERETRWHLEGGCEWCRRCGTKNHRHATCKEDLDNAAAKPHILGGIEGQNAICIIVAWTGARHATHLTCHNTNWKRTFSNNHSSVN